jgi:signal transduction histidine kinase
MNLCLRLFLTNLTVLVSGLVCATIVAQSYKAQEFSSGLAQVEQTLQQLKRDSATQDFLNEALRWLYVINDRGTLAAFVSCFLVIGILSIYFGRSILMPLRAIEQKVEQFSAGDLAVRIHPSGIPEIRQLELTLNSFADRLQSIEKRHQELIGDLAHEIGTPLTVIRGYLELFNSSERFEFTTDIRGQLYEEAERMTRLLSDLTVLSKIEAEGLPLRLEPFSPYFVLKGIVINFHTKGWLNECCLELVDSENLPQISADCDRFKQILANLISNALAYTPQGTVMVRAWADRDKLWVMVKDTGIGISSEDLPHVFQRFWRSQQSRSLRCEGSGIGLAITERLVKVMGGRIEVESVLGQGTTFRFYLPIVTSHHGS